MELLPGQMYTVYAGKRLMARLAVFDEDNVAFKFYYPHDVACTTNMKKTPALLDMLRTTAHSLKELFRMEIMVEKA